MVHAAMADGDKSQAERDFVRDLSLQLDEQGGAKQLAEAVQAPTRSAIWPNAMTQAVA